MKKINKILIVSFILLIFINIFCSGSVFAAINKGYSSESAPTFNSHIEVILSDNIVVKALEHFIYWIANALETLIKNIFGALTGSYVFPWADGIIFNSVALLDINFINPSTGSLFLNTSGNSTPIGAIFKNLYYTVFVLAVGFFSVCVGVMALRLVFSSIASEKAKYKKATLNCFMSLLMLFTTQYLISFIFFVNEKLVTSASMILSDKIESFTFESEVKSALEARQDNLSKDGLLGTNNPSNIKETIQTDAYNYYSQNYIGDQTQTNEEQTKKNEVSRISAYSRLSESDITNLGKTLSSNKYYKYAVLIITGKFQDVDLTNDPLWIKYKDEEMVSYNVIDGVGTYGIYNPDKGRIKDNLGSDNTTAYTYYRFINLISDIKYTADSGGASKEQIKSNYTNYTDVADTQHLFIQNCKRFVVNSKSAENGATSQAKTLYKKRMSSDELADFIKKVHDSLKDVEYDDVTNLNNENVFSGLGDFFKQSAYDSSKKKDKYNFIACIVYAIFLIQSIMYFIAYFKRFFYILILAMFAPIVIVYDFFTKSFT